MRPAALLAVNHGAHVRGLHTHNPSLTPVIHFQLQSCSTRPLCQLIHTKTSIFYSYTHTHTHTNTHLHTPSTPLQAQGGGSWAQCPEARGPSPAKRQAGTELGDELRGHGGLPSCTDILSLEKGRGSQYRAAPGQKGIGSL